MRWTSGTFIDGKPLIEASRVRGSTRIAIYCIFGSGVLGKRTEVRVISVLMCGIIGYAALGLAFAGTRIAAAEHAVDTVVSHQNTLNATFRSINIQLTALGASSFDAATA